MVHLSSYQDRDFEVVDYSMYELGETGLQFRGPAPVPEALEPGSYIACIGAAQTFGCLCQEPFPSMLAKALDLPVLNLGYGGAGPEFFDQQRSLDAYINNSRCVVIQVMSGRSQSNSIFDTDGLELLTRKADGRQLSSVDAYHGVINELQRFSYVPRGRVDAALIRRLNRSGTRALVNETRQRWVNSYASLIQRIQVPKLLFWFSKRRPNYRENYLSVKGIFNEYPQLIDAESVKQVAGLCDEYVECVTDRGSPQQLFSRFTGQQAMVDPGNDRPDLGGQVWTHDHYYPSPEMHEDACIALKPVVNKYLQRL
ncbi:DUF6473 family protein [Allohahella sp. A8]|uniref:DUF6473 family protein n=1 Tax=Allohahella sp. A8 TaxID=3141461 RepID=UPI003A812B6B